MKTSYDFAALAGVLREPEATLPGGRTGEKAEHFEQGQVFGRYRLVEEIARGGFGVVYRAWQPDLGREVAVKVLRDGLTPSSADIERFRREATAAAGLRHRHIVTIHEIGEAQGRHFFSMEFIAGATLSQRLAGGPLPAREAATAVMKLAGAVAHAHGRGVLHRDIKPSNILLDGEDEPMLTDFGLAWQDPATSGKADLTMTGQILGTPAYMAPEQAEGHHENVAEATDVYGLGALFYHCLTGRAPYAGDSAVSIVRQLLDAPPPAIRLLNASVPADLCTIVEKAMHREPRRRYHTAQSMADDIGRWLTGVPIHARPAPPLEKGWKWMLRHPVLSTAAALVLLGSSTIAVTSTLASRRLAVANKTAAAAQHEAEETARSARLTLYAADMRAAYDYFDGGDFRSLDRMLDTHDPAKEPALAAMGLDPRGFEWHHLKHRSVGDQTATIPVSQRCEDAAFSTDGRHLVLGGMPDKPTLLMEVADDGTLRQLMAWQERFRRGTSQNWRLRPLPGAPGQFIAVTDGGAHVLDPATGQRRVLIETTVFDLALSPDGQWLAALTVRDGKEVVVVNRIADGAEIRGWFMMPTGLEWRADGKLWIVAVPSVVRDDGKTPKASLFLYDPAQPDPLETHPIGGLKATPDFGIIRASNDLIVLDTGFEAVGIRHSTRQIIWQESKDLTTPCIASEDGKHIAIAGFDPRIKVIDAADGGLQYIHRGHRQHIITHAFRSSTSLISLSADGTLRLWGTADGTESYHGRTARRLVGSLTPIPLSPDGRWAGFISTTGFLSSEEPRGRLWDIIEDKKGASLPGVPIRVSNGGDSAIILQRKALQQLDTATGRLTLLCDLPDGWKKWLPRLSACGRYLAAAHSSRSWRLLEIPGGRIVREFTATIDEMPEWHPAEPRFAFSEGGGKLTFFNAATGELTPTRWISHGCHAWSPDGRRLAVSYFQEVNIIDPASHERLQQLPGSNTAIRGLLWTPDARTLVSMSNKELHFWNLATGREAMHMPIIGHDVSAFITPDGSQLCLSADKGTQVLRTR